MSRTRVKICCIQNIEEARLAVQLGADALGLVAAMPSGPGPISEDLIAEIVRETPACIATVLLTSEKDVDRIIAQQRKTGCNTLQLCASLQSEQHEKLRYALPGVKLLQVIHVCDEESYDEAMNAAVSADGILLDTGAPKADVPVLGGTGQTHDWSISRRIVTDCGKPVWLAGGLRYDNVCASIEKVAPFGVDICTGVRCSMELDEQKLRDFLCAVRESDSV